MKVLFFAVVLANIVVFMWEYRQGAFSPANKAPQQQGQEPILLVSELQSYKAGPVIDIDYISLYPPGLDPLADNLLTEPVVLEDFTGEFLFFAESQNEAIALPSP